jgi:hypothetical protein
VDGPFPTADATGALVPSGVYLPILLKLYGEIVAIPGPIPTPHTGENAAYAISFLPAVQLFANPANPAQPSWPMTLIYYLVYLNTVAKIDLPRVLVQLEGDFVYALDAANNYTELGVLDANNIGGRVGEPPPAARLPPIQGGKNPSGDLAQGGTFSSWFFLSMRDGQAGGFKDEALKAAPAFNAFGTNALAMPPMPAVAAFSSAEQIAAATGVSPSLARRIVAERTKKPFASAADLRGRLKLSDEDSAKLDKTLVIL